MTRELVLLNNQPDAIRFLREPRPCPCCEATGTHTLSRVASPGNVFMGEPMHIEIMVVSCWRCLMMGIDLAWTPN